MIAIPTRQRMLENSILSNTYCFACLHEIAQLIQQCASQGKFVMIYGFPSHGNENENDRLVEYLKLKKYKVIKEPDGQIGQRIRIKWG